MAGALQVAKGYGPDDILLINLSGRGDKDMETVAEFLGIRLREDGEERA